MGWRTLIIKDSEKISLYLDNILIKKETANLKIPISDINCILFEDYKTIITTRLITKLSKSNILLIVCDEKLMPCSQIFPIEGKFDQLLVIKEQINWNKEFKVKMWTTIIAQKINNQIDVLKNNNKSTEKIQMLYNYITELKDGDITNREGHAAKVYFKELFGNNFVRTDENNLINQALNYGYSILRTAISRTIVAKGMHPSIALFHHNRYNAFALADDLIEPFRPIVDDFVFNNFYKWDFFGRNQKIQLINLLNSTLMFNLKEVFLTTAIEEYINSFLISFKNENLFLIKFPFPEVVTYYEL